MFRRLALYLGTSSTVVLVETDPPGLYANFELVTNCLLAFDCHCSPFASAQASPCSPQSGLQDHSTSKIYSPGPQRFCEPPYLPPGLKGEGSWGFAWAPLLPFPQGERAISGEIVIATFCILPRPCGCRHRSGLFRISISASLRRAENT